MAEPVDEGLKVALKYEAHAALVRWLAQGGWAAIGAKPVFTGLRGPILPPPPAWTAWPRIRNVT